MAILAPWLIVELTRAGRADSQNREECETVSPIMVSPGVSVPRAVRQVLSKRRFVSRGLQLCTEGLTVSASPRSTPEQVVAQAPSHRGQRR